MNDYRADILAQPSAMRAALDGFGQRLLRDASRRLGGPANNEDSHWRETGYREALAAKKLEWDPQLMRNGQFDRSVAEVSIRTLLSAGIPFDAVYACDDESAVGVYNALRAAGIRIPEDVSIVGFDDQRFAAYLNPPLTTVRAHTEDVGRIAARQLLNSIRNEAANPLTLVSTEIIFRRSCGCRGD